MNNWKNLAGDLTIAKTVEKLLENGIEVHVVSDAKSARAKVLQIIPEGSEVMNMTSVTSDSIGLSKYVDESGKYISVKNKLKSMDRQTQGKMMQMIGSAPDWVVGSVHAVTQAGQVIIASNTGSQLGAYAYGSPHVLWIVGTQKIVKNLDEGMKRIYDYVLPLESQRAREAYGKPDSYNSFVSKLLIINKEVKPGRIVLIFVKEILGF